MTVDPRPGCDVKDIAEECQKLADRIGIQVRCQVNGCQLLAYPGGSAERLVAGFHAQFGKPAGHYRVAHSA